MSSAQNNPRSSRLDLRHMVIFAMLGAVMFATTYVMKILPNIHLLGMFIMVFTLVYRQRALIPLYVYVFLEGLFGGFALWWVPYLYVWTVLWGVTMLLPRRMPPKLQVPIYMLVCALHGLCFGLLYAPAQVVLFGLPLRSLPAWILSGLPFDLLHAVGNFAAGALIVPLSRLLQKLELRIGNS